MASLEECLVLLQKGLNSEEDLCLTLQNKFSKLSQDLDISDTKDNDGWSFLHWACQNRMRELCRLSLSYRHSLFVQDNLGCTPLMLACFLGDQRLVKLLSGMDEKPQTASQHQDTLNPAWLQKTNPVLTPARAKHLRDRKQVQVIYHLAGAPYPDAQGKFLVSPRADGRSEELRPSESIDPLEVGRNLAMHTKAKSRDRRVLEPQKVVSNGNQLTARDKLFLMTNNYGATCLQYALTRSHVEIVDYLCKECGNLLLGNADYFGETPLHHGVRFGNKECVKIMLNWRADVCARNNVFELPLDIALKGSSSSNASSIIALLEDSHENRVPQLLTCSEVRSTISNLLRQETLRAYNKKKHMQAKQIGNTTD